MMKKFAFAKFIFSLFIFSYLIAVAQENSGYVPRDTSYTSKSAFLKVRQSYPRVKLVTPFTDLDIIENKNLVYTKYGERKLVLDLISPINEQRKKLPLIILIHGGGWSSGDRSMILPLAQQLSHNGFITAAIEYRLSPEELYPSAIIDILNSIKWLKNKSDDFNIDSTKVALLGCSAGGHLAALAATNYSNKTFSTSDTLRNISSEVNAVINVDGVLDLTHPAESGKDTNIARPSVLKRWLGYAFNENPEIWKQASPVNHVTQNTPPILFINSSISRFHAGRDEMIEKMQEYNIYSEIHTFENSPHSFWLFDPWFNSTVELVIDFLNRLFSNEIHKIQSK